MADEVKIIRLVIDASKAVDGGKAAQRALEQIERNTMSLDKALAAMEKQLMNVAKSVKAHLVLALTEIAYKIMEAGKRAFDTAAGLAELAEQAGTTADYFQALNYAGVQGGVGIEEMQKATAKFSQKIGEASNGSKEMLDALDNLGVKILDGAGKLRSTESIMQNVAAAISEIDDPAKRSAAAVEFFGKAGAKMLTVIKDIALGTDTLKARAAQAGVLISDETISKLDDFADKLEVNKLKTIAFFADILATGLTWLEKGNELFNGWAQSSNRWLKSQIADFGDWVDSVVSPALDSVVLAGARFIGTFVGLFAGLPDQLGKLFVDAMNAAIGAMESGLNVIGRTLVEKAPWLAGKLNVTGNEISFGRLDGGGASVGDMWAAAKARGAAAEEALRKDFGYGPDGANSRYAARMTERRANGTSAEAALGAVDAIAPVGSVPSGYKGTSNPPAKGGGTSPEEKYAKLIEQLNVAAQAQDLMTAAAAKGSQTFEDQKTHLDAVNKTLEIFGHRLADNDPRLTKVEELLKRIAQGKAAEAFAVATTELENQNKVLEAQIALIDQAPEIQARELAIIKAKNDALKAGIDLESQAYKDRVAAIEQNEKLKIQQDQIKQSIELWTEPAKQAFRDIQKAGADAWDQILATGKIDFQSLGDVFKTTLRRMAAEFLALATIRPIMTVGIQALGSAGILSPATVASMGGGNIGTGSMGGFPSLSFGGGNGGLFGSGGLFSSNGYGIGGSGSIFQGAVPSEAGVYGPQMPGGLNGLSSFFNPSTGLQMGSFGLGNLSGALGIGMGAMSLLNGGTKTAAGTIGGIGQMIGGGLMMIPTPWTMAAGAVISLASSILPGLFGSKEPTITNQAYGQLSYGSGGFGTSGGAWGPSADANTLTGPLAQAGSSIQGIFDALGGVKDSGKVWGVALQSMSQQYGSKGGTFANQTSFLIDPQGNKTQWGMGSTAADVGMEAASAQVAIRSIIGGAVGAVSEAMKTALSTVGARSGGGSLQQVGEAVSFVRQYDSLGKTITESEKAVKQITASFDAMKKTAESLGLSLEPVNAELGKQTGKVASDFRDSLQRQLDDMIDPRVWQLKDLAAWRDSVIANNDWLLANVEGTQDQIAKIEELYGKKRQAIIEGSASASTSAMQSMQSAASSLLGAVHELTFGQLSGASPADMFGGAKGTYMATLAQAQSGDVSALGRLGSDAMSYVNAGRSYYGTTADYSAIVNQVREALLQQAANFEATAAKSSTAGNDAASSEVVRSNVALVQQVATQQAALDRLTQQLADVTAQMQRIAVTAGR